MKRLYTTIVVILCCLTICPQALKMKYGDSDRKGVPFAKDPYVIKYKGSYWMYYSITASPDGTMGWGIGIAKSKDLNNWTKVSELNPSENLPMEKKGICAPCA